MLYYSFECLIDLLSLDRCDYRSYIDAFRAYRRLHVHLDDFYTDLVADSHNTDSEDSESVRNESDDEPLVDFEVFARQWPYNDDLTCSFTDDLGSCSLDRTYDWTSYVGRNTTTPEA